MTWARASYDSVRGKISSDWKIEDGKLLLKVTIPANTTATVQIPTSNAASLLIDGKPSAGHPAKGGFVIFEIGSGDYEFSVDK